MNETLTLLAIGFALIVLLVFLLRRRDPEADNDSSLADAYSALSSPSFGERQKQVLERVFGQEDWDFVRRKASRQVQEKFLRERRGIALFWIAQVRNQAKTAMRLHLTRVRGSEEVQPFGELTLAMHYLAFRVACGFIAAVLWIVGPMALRSMVAQVVNLSDNLRALLDVSIKPETYSEKTRIR